MMYRHRWVKETKIMDGNCVKLWNMYFHWLCASSLYPYYYEEFLRILVANVAIQRARFIIACRKLKNFFFGKRVCICVCVWWTSNEIYFLFTSTLMTVYAFYIAYYILAVLLKVFILKSKVVFYIVLFPLCFSNILILWQIVELFVNLYRFMCMCVCFPWRSVNFCSMLLASLLLPKLKHFFNRLKCLSIKYNEGIQTRYRSFIY